MQPSSPLLTNQALKLWLNTVPKSSLWYGDDDWEQDSDRTRADYLEVTAEKETPPNLIFRELEEKGLENPTLLFHL